MSPQPIDFRPPGRSEYDHYHIERLEREIKALENQVKINKDLVSLVTKARNELQADILEVCEIALESGTGQTRKIGEIKWKWEQS